MTQILPQGNQAPIIAAELSGAHGVYMQLQTEILDSTLPKG